MEIMQGDAYDIPLKVTINDLLVTPESVEKIEACIGSVSKIFPDMTRNANVIWFHWSKRTLSA